VKWGMVKRKKYTIYQYKKVPIPRYKLGDYVKVKGLNLRGKIGKTEYRFYNKMWYYRVKNINNERDYRWWSEKSLRKIPKRKKR